jgi:hypothetical protein
MMSDYSIAENGALSKEGERAALKASLQLLPLYYHTLSSEKSAKRLVYFAAIFDRLSPAALAISSPPKRQLMYTSK